MLVSSHCTDCLLVEGCGLCMSAEQDEEGGGVVVGVGVGVGVWDPSSRLKYESKETRAPHFLSPLYQHLALLFLRS